MSGLSACSSCTPGTYTTNIGASSSLDCKIVMQLFQFRPPYLLSEVTDNIKLRMSTAVANLLAVLVSNVVLTISSVERRQQTSLLVIVGITNVQGSAASYLLRVTQERFNTEMKALGLKSGQVEFVTGISCELMIQN